MVVASILNGIRCPVHAPTLSVLIFLTRLIDPDPVLDSALSPHYPVDPLPVRLRSLQQALQQGLVYVRWLVYFKSSIWFVCEVFSFNISSNVGKTWSINGKRTCRTALSLNAWSTSNHSLSSDLFPVFYQMFVWLLLDGSMVLVTDLGGRWTDLPACLEEENATPLFYLTSHNPPQILFGPTISQNDTGFDLKSPATPEDNADSFSTHNLLSAQLSATSATSTDTLRPGERV